MYVVYLFCVILDQKRPSGGGLSATQYVKAPPDTPVIFKDKSELILEDSQPEDNSQHGEEQSNSDDPEQAASISENIPVLRDRKHGNKRRHKKKMIDDYESQYSDSDVAVKLEESLRKLYTVMEEMEDTVSSASSDDSLEKTIPTKKESKHPTGNKSSFVVFGNNGKILGLWNVSPAS